MASLNQALYFNFHNLVAVEVSTEREEDAAFFAAEYASHRAQALPLSLPLVHLSFKRRAWPPLPGGYTFHQYKLLARWGYRLNLEADRVQIDVIGNRLAVPMVHHMLLHPSLRYLSTRRGVLLLHAGAIAQGGKSLIFSGHGGAGKTTITSLVLARGGASWSPHADDYVFLAPGPESLAYVTRSHLYRDLLRWVPEIGARLKPGERLRLEIFGRLRRWSAEQVKWPVRLPVERLWPGQALQERATPAALVILERTEQLQRPRLRRLQAEELPLEDLISMNFFEARHFLHLAQKAGASPDLDAWARDWRRREYELLQQRCREIPIYALELPRQIDASVEFQADLVETLAGLTANEQEHAAIQS